MGSSESSIFIQCLSITPGKKSDNTHKKLSILGYGCLLAGKSAVLGKTLSCLVQVIVASWVQMQKMETGRSFIVEGSKRGAKCNLFFRRNKLWTTVRVLTHHLPGVP